MEDMCPVLMHIDALDVLTIDVAAEVWTLVDDQAPLALAVGFIGVRATIDTGAYNQ
jgi:hypothetical protein